MHHHDAEGGADPREVGRHAIRDPHHGGQGRHSQAEPWNTDPNEPLSADPDLFHEEHGPGMTPQAPGEAGQSPAGPGPRPRPGRTLYLDCTTGVSGDMLLAALADAGGLFDVLRRELARLPVDSFALDISERMVAGIRTRRVEVVQTRNEPLRHLPDLLSILERSSLAPRVKARAAEVFTLLGQAEATVHGVALDQVHFHEIGAVDTLVDVVGVLALAEALAPDRVAASAVNLGSGFVRMAHGTLPVPAPAVAELARGMLVFSTDLGMETATPTGLALVKHLAGEQGPLPLGRLTGVGLGSGGRSSDARPTCVRAFVLEG